MGLYRDELTRSMTMIGEDPRTLFLGQAVEYAGTGMYGTLSGVPMEKRIELPVAEELQMGMTVGLAMAGHIPISIYPRLNFLLLAMNQLVNHLDKLRVMWPSNPTPRAIIRTSIGSERPLHPGPQHVGDFTAAIRAMCTSIVVIRLDEPEDIVQAYWSALNRQDGRSTILVEWGDYYAEK